LTSFGWNLLNQLSDSSNLALFDYYLFPKVKEYLSGKHVFEDEEGKIEVGNWFKELADHFFDERMKNGW